MYTLEEHQYFMRLALEESKKAAAVGEVPTGCIIVQPPAEDAPRHLRSRPAGKIVARAYNQTEMLRDPTAHAEMLAITQAAAALGDWRLTGTILYVTKEPCCMCAGAIVLARPACVVWGLSDPKRGGHSVFSILDHEGLNHRPEILSGVLEDECKAVFQTFFRERRSSKEERDVRT